MHTTVTQARELLAGAALAADILRATVAASDRLPPYTGVAVAELTAAARAARAAVGLPPFPSHCVRPSARTAREQLRDLAAAAYAAAEAYRDARPLTDTPAAVLRLHTVAAIELHGPRSRNLDRRGR